MKKRIREIYKCLDARLYEAALALSLTLPDICGQIEYPDLGVAARYKKWVNNYIDKINEDSKNIKKISKIYNCKSRR